MPSLKLYINEGVAVDLRAAFVARVRQRFAGLPDDIRKDAVLACISCGVDRGEGANDRWLEVKCSKGTSPETVVLIANSFLDIVDVEAYNPEAGYFRFRPKGSSIKVEDL